MADTRQVVIVNIDHEDTLDGQCDVIGPFPDWATACDYVKQHGPELVPPGSTMMTTLARLTPPIQD